MSVIYANLIINLIVDTTARFSRLEIVKYYIRGEFFDIFFAAKVPPIKV